MSIRPETITMLLVAALVSMPIAGQDKDPVHPWLDDDLVLSFGVFVPRKEFNLSVDGEVPGREIDFDRFSGTTDTQSTASINARWKFNEDWSVSGQYWSTDDSGEAVLMEDVNWGDNVLRAGSSVKAGVDVDVARVFFGREFFTDEKLHEFGLGAGLHWLRIGAFIEGEMFINDESRGVRRESVSAEMPLPNIGAWYWRSLSPRWLVTTHADWFSASLDEYSGSLWNLGAGFQYQVSDHFGIGLSYQYFKIDVEVDKSSWRGDAQLTQDGAFLSLNINW